MPSQILKELETNINRGIESFKNLKNKHQSMDKGLVVIFDIIARDLQILKKVPNSFQDSWNLYINLLEIELLLTSSKTNNWITDALSLAMLHLENNVDKGMLYQNYHQIELIWQNLQPEIMRAKTGSQLIKQYNKSKKIRENLSDWVDSFLEEDLILLKSLLKLDYLIELESYISCLRANPVRPLPPPHLPQWVQEFFMQMHLQDADYEISVEQRLPIVISYYQQKNLAEPTLTEVNVPAFDLMPEESQILWLKENQENLNNSMSRILLDMNVDLAPIPSAPPLLEEEKRQWLGEATTPAVPELLGEELEAFYQNVQRF